MAVNHRNEENISERFLAENGRSIGVVANQVSQHKMQILWSPCIISVTDEICGSYWLVIRPQDPLFAEFELTNQNTIE